MLNDDDERLFGEQVSALTGFLKAWEPGLAGNQTAKALAHGLFAAARRVGPHALEQAARVLSRAFSLSLSDRSDAAVAVKKTGVSLHLAVLLLRVYFILGTQRLCGNVVRAIVQGPPEVQLKHCAELNVRLQWHYFNGRLELDRLDFSAAAEHFAQAGAVCRPQTRLFRTLMLYLAVAGMVGECRSPSRAAAERVLPPPFQEMLKFWRLGDVRSMEASIRRHQTAWTKSRLYLTCLLFLRQGALRNLLRRTALALGLLREARVPLTAFHAACRVMMDEGVCADEAECLLAGLIASKRVRGYISREHHTLVLSKKNPFP